MAEKRKLTEPGETTGCVFVLESIAKCMVEVIESPLFYGRKHNDDDRDAHWCAFDSSTAFRYGPAVFKVHIDPTTVLNMDVRAIKLLLAIAKQHEKGPEDIGIQYVSNNEEMSKAKCDERASGVSFLYNPETQALRRRSVKTDKNFIDFLNEHLSDISEALGQPVKGFVSRLAGHHPEVYLRTPVKKRRITEDVYLTPPPACRVTAYEDVDPTKLDFHNQ